MPLVLVLASAAGLSACAASGGAFTGGDGDTSAATRGSSTLIVRAQLADLTGLSAWDAIDTYNPRWLRSQRGTSLASGPSYARVVVDGVTRGDLEELTRLRNDTIENIRYLSAPDATTKYGTGFPGGAIEVTIRRN